MIILFNGIWGLIFVKFKENYKLMMNVHEKELKCNKYIKVMTKLSQGSN